LSRLFFFCTVLFSFFLIADGLSDLSTSSEAREILVSRTIAEGGAWIAPTRNGIIASKPPLHHWITASIANLLDLPVTIFMHRAVSSGAAFLVLLIVGYTVFVIFERSSFGERRALTSVVVLSSTPIFLRLASDARVDMVFALCVVSALCRFLFLYARATHWEELADDSGRTLGLAMGAACLAKGPLGIVLPLSIIFCILAFQFGIRRAVWITFRPRPTAWLLLLCTGPLWYLVGVVYGGQPFIARHFSENIVRIVGEGRPPWYYVESWFTRIFPWSLIFLGLVMKRESFSPGRLVGDLVASQKVERLERALLLGCAVGTVLFTLSSGKRHAYLLPLSPFMAMYLAFRITDLYERASNRSKEKVSVLVRKGRPLVLGFLLLNLMVFALIPVFPWWDQRVQSDLLRYTASSEWLLLLSFLEMVMLLTLVRSPRWRMLQVSGALIACAITLNGFGQGVKAEFKGFHRFAREIRERVPLESSIAIEKTLSDERYDLLLFYLDRPVSLHHPESGSGSGYDYFITAGREGRGEFVLSYETLGSYLQESEDEVFTLTRGEGKRNESESGEHGDVQKEKLWR
jgi:4-amino-4-deoxy-L-arabinose transferase-like glycosyltransferase